MLTVVSFNTNGIRVREHQLSKIIENHSPDIIGIQESKVQDQDFPIEMIESLGYSAEYFGQKSHYGVALLFKNKPNSVKKGFPDHAENDQRRVISAECTIDNKSVTVVNAYFPQGDSRTHETKFPAKKKFYEDMLSYFKSDFEPTQNVILMGDMNVASIDEDIGIGEDNKKRWLKAGKASFLPEEREWLSSLANWGLEDSFRHLNPKLNDRFSWFDYRSKGFDKEPKRGLRIDLIMATQALIEKLETVDIDYEVRAMIKPSDHCPICASFKL